MASKDEWPLAVRIAMAVVWSLFCVGMLVWWTAAARLRPPWFVPVAQAIAVAIAVLYWVGVGGKGTWLQMLASAGICVDYFFTLSVDLLGKTPGEHPMYLILRMLIALAITYWFVEGAMKRRTLATQAQERDAVEGQ